MFSIEGGKLRLQVPAKGEHAAFNMTLGHGAQHTSSPETIRVMTSVMESIEKIPSKLPPRSKRHCKHRCMSLKRLGANTDKISKLKTNLAYTLEKTKSVGTLTAELMEKPGARKFLGKEELEAVGFKDVASLDSLIADKAKIAELIKDKTVDRTKEIEEILIKHHGADTKVTESLVAGSQKLET